MAGLDAALNQAGYRADGLLASFGPWANAWSPAWLDSSSRIPDGQTVANDALPNRQAPRLAAGDTQQRPLSGRP